MKEAKLSLGCCWNVSLKYNNKKVSLNKAKANMSTINKRSQYVKMLFNIVVNYAG